MKWTNLLNKISIGCAGLAIGLALGGMKEEASFLLLLAIYVDGRLFLSH